MEPHKFALANRLKDELLDAIEKEMVARGISQGEIARRIGALRRNVNQVMGRKKNASLDYILKMAESIELKVELRIRRPKP